MLSPRSSTPPLQSKSFSRITWWKYLNCDRYKGLSTPFGASGTRAKKCILSCRCKPPRLSFVVDPAVVPTTSSRVNVQAASAASESGPPAPSSEQVPGGASGISSSQPSSQPELSALLSNSSSAAGISTGGRKQRSLFPQEADGPEQG